MGNYGTTIDPRTPLFRAMSDDTAILAEAIRTRLATAAGTLWTKPEYGRLLADYLQAGITADAVARIPGEVQAELLEDERIASVEVTASVVPALAGARVELMMTVYPRVGPSFPLTLPISTVSVATLTNGG